MYNQFEIETHLDGKLKVAYLNQPEIMNAITKPLLKELKQFFDECSNDETLRCVAISGRGRAFCSGQNLGEALNMDAKNDEAVIVRIVEDYYNPMVKSIVECRKPVISLVNGAAVGAGAMLALICDFTLATKSSYFAQSFVNIGLIPDTAGTYYLPKLLGRQLASYLAFTGKKLSAEEAKNMNLIAEVFEDETFAENSMEILTRISNMPTKAISITKKAFNESYSNSLDKQLEGEAKWQQAAAKSEDFMEGVTAFLQKRKPEFKGK